MTQVAYQLPETKVDNVVANFHLGVQFTDGDMKRLESQVFPGSENKNHRFKGIRLRGEDGGKGIVLTIYKTGSVLLLGKSIDQIYSVSERLVRRLRSFGYLVSLVRLRVCNVVLSAQLPFEIDLKLFAFKHSKYAVYNPDDFPGLCYRLASRHGLRVSLTVYATGKIVIRSKRHDEAHINEVLSCLVPHFYDNRPRLG